MDAELKREIIMEHYQNPLNKDKVIGEGYEKVNISNGIIESSNDTVKKIGSIYLGNFTKTYYTKEGNEKEYHTAKCADFDIYSAYEAGFSENSKEKAVTNFT